MRRHSRTFLRGALRVEEVKRFNAEGAEVRAQSWQRKRNLRSAARYRRHFYRESRNRKYEGVDGPVGVVVCGRAVRMILKYSRSEGRSSRTSPPSPDISGWMVAR